MNLCLDFRGSLRSIWKFKVDEGRSLQCSAKRNKRAALRPSTSTSQDSSHVPVTGQCHPERSPSSSGELRSACQSPSKPTASCSRHVCLTPQKDQLSGLGCSPGAAPPLARTPHPQGCCAGKVPLLGSLPWVTVGTEILAPQVLVPRSLSNASQQISFC